MAQGNLGVGGISMSDQSREVSGESRREFLKKAGKVAWVVPTIQVVNMAAAAAGEHRRAQGEQRDSQRAASRGQTAHQGSPAIQTL